jgi:hypothetical protein
MDGRYITDGRESPERFHLYRLCECTTCGATGKLFADARAGNPRCGDCRGEGRTRELVATCGTPEALGVALVTLAREGEWEGCPIGVLDTMGEKGERWLVRPWTPSARNVTDAAKLLRSQQGKGK